jgi:hypothetical protein
MVFLIFESSFTQGFPKEPQARRRERSRVLEVEEVLTGCSIVGSRGE